MSADVLTPGATSSMYAEKVSHSSMLSRCGMRPLMSHPSNMRRSAAQISCCGKRCTRLRFGAGVEVMALTLDSEWSKRLSRNAWIRCLCPGVCLHVHEYPSIFGSILRAQEKSFMSRSFPPRSGASLHVEEYPSKSRSIPPCPGVSLQAQEHPSMSRSIPLCPGVSLRVQEYLSMYRSIPPCPGVSLLVQKHQRRGDHQRSLIAARCTQAY